MNEDKELILFDEQVEILCASIIARADSRELIDLCPMQNEMDSWRRHITPAFQLYLHYCVVLTDGAHKQLELICKSGYTFAEALGMMLEQLDYWDQDRATLCEMVVKYLDGQFDSVY